MPMEETPTAHDAAPTERPRRRIAPNAWFFPAAALYAAVVLPWSVLALARIVPAPAALASAFGHAHEMLLGYALAVVAGNQLPPMSRRRALLVFALWASARLAFITLPGGAGLAFDVAFALALVVQVVPRLFSAAKKIRNQALPAVLTALCAAAVGFDVAMVAAGAAALHSVVLAIVLLLAALMLFMGGRVIAPAAAGEFYRRGQPLAARVQPRIEAALLAVMAVAVASAIVPRYDDLMRAACAAAGVLALVRLLRWRLWMCTGRPDLLCLGVGYAWLAVGLMALGASTAGTVRTAAVHVITIGALGTLTLNVMANTMMLKAKRSPAGEQIPLFATALVGAATLLRVGAAFASGHSVGLLSLAAACWSAAFLAVSWLIGRCVVDAAHSKAGTAR